MNDVPLVELVKEAGVVGAGGAGFPTHLKLSARPSFVIINGAECEPLLRVDQQLLETEREALRDGLLALERALGPARIFLAIKAKHRRLISAWRETGLPPVVTIFELGDYYPAGDEQSLVKDVTGRTVPEGGIPMQVGTVVLNVETLYNVSRSLNGLPVIEKFVTVAGAVREPQTMRIPLGVSFGELLERAGGPTEEQAAFLQGGPMMGKLISDLSQPVTKTTKGLLVLPERLNFVAKMTMSWAGIRQRASQCEICRMCTDMCPRYLLGHGLEPHKIVRYYAYGGENMGINPFVGALLCVECGVCENYACPANIFPRRLVAEVKGQLIARGIRLPKDKVNEPVSHEYREARRVPTKRLIARLGLGSYDVPAPLREVEAQWKRVTIPLKPAYGAACQPVVKVGDRVKRGDLIGEIPEGKVGSRVHASISGVVTVVNDLQVVIESEGSCG